VRRISGLDPLVGRDACRRQVQDFLDGLKAPQTIKQLTLAFDEENKVSVVEFDQSFSHKTHGDISQRIMMVQRWREDQIYDDTIYVMSRS
jgi:Zn ribbon nucleic-acid-binding protein